MGGLLIMTDARTGGSVVVEASPGMTVPELAEKLKEKGVVEEGESVVFGVVNDEGKFEPRRVGSVRDLEELARAGHTIAFSAERIHGSHSEHISDLCKFYGFRWNPAMGAYTANFVSAYDDRLYLVVVECSSRPDEPPRVTISPYPSYVLEDPEFQRSHAAQCLFPRRTKDGRLVGEWHVEPRVWLEYIEGCTNPLAIVLESLTQILRLYPTF